MCVSHLRVCVVISHCADDEHSEALCSLCDSLRYEEGKRNPPSDILTLITTHTADLCTTFPTVPLKICLNLSVIFYKC